MSGLLRVPLTTLARIDRHASARKPMNITLSRLEEVMSQANKMSQANTKKQLRVSNFVRQAQWLQDEVPLRVAHRLVDFHRLPFIAMRCEPLSKVWATYLEDFNSLVAFPRVKSGDDVLAFKDHLKESQLNRLHVIGDTRRAIGELNQFPDVKDSLEAFLTKLFITRIGRLLLEDHFIAYVEHAASGNDASARPQSDGVVTETRLAPLLESVSSDLQGLVTQLYGQSAKVNITTFGSATVHSIPKYLKFIFQEILKNALKATMEQHPLDPPQVQVSVITGKFDVQVKISDQGGGMPRKVLKHIWRYGYSGFQESHSGGDAGAGLMADQTMDTQKELSGYGVGLPLSRLYMRYLGGEVQMSQVLGHGTEVSIVLRQHDGGHDGDHEEFDEEHGDCSTVFSQHRSTINFGSLRSP